MQTVVGDNAHGNGFTFPFTIGNEEVGRYLLRRDPTGEVFGNLRFMDQVEDWVLNRHVVDEASRAEVRQCLDRLAGIVSQYRNRIPPDNEAFLRPMAWLNTSFTVYVVDYLTAEQPEFFMQLVDYCQANEGVSLNATLMLKRVRALWRAGLLRRIYSQENVDFVMNILVKEALL